MQGRSETRRRRMRRSSQVSTFQSQANRTDWSYAWTIGVVRDRISQPLSVRIPLITFDHLRRAMDARRHGDPQKGLKSDFSRQERPKWRLGLYRR